MSMAIPVLHGVQGESAEIVEREGVGVCFEPESSTELCKALEKLAQDDELYERLKGNGPKAALKYDRSELAGKMLNVVTNISGKK